MVSALRMQAPAFGSDAKKSARCSKFVAGGQFKGGLPSAVDALLSKARPSMNEEWEKLRALLLKFRKDQFKATADRGSFHREAEQFRRDLAVALQGNSDLRAEVASAEGRAEERIAHLRSQLYASQGQLTTVRAELGEADVLVSRLSARVGELEASAASLAQEL